MLKEGSIDCGKFEEVSVRARRGAREAPGWVSKTQTRGLSSLGATFPTFPPPALHHCRLLNLTGPSLPSPRHSLDMWHSFRSGFARMSVTNPYLRLCLKSLMTSETSLPRQTPHLPVLEIILRAVRTVNFTVKKWKQQCLVWGSCECERVLSSRTLGWLERRSIGNGCQILPFH